MLVPIQTFTLSLGNYHEPCPCARLAQEDRPVPALGVCLGRGRKINIYARDDRITITSTATEESAGQEEGAWLSLGDFLEEGALNQGPTGALCREEREPAWGPRRTWNPGCCHGRAHGKQRPSHGPACGSGHHSPRRPVRGPVGRGPHGTGEPQGPVWASSWGAEAGDQHETVQGHRPGALGEDGNYYRAQHHDPLLRARPRPQPRRPERKRVRSRTDPHPTENEGRRQTLPSAPLPPLYPPQHTHLIFRSSVWKGRNSSDMSSTLRSKFRGPSA